jgi:hypothetical protein
MKYTQPITQRAKSNPAAAPKNQEVTIDPQGKIRSTYFDKGCGCEADCECDD